MIEAGLLSACAVASLPDSSHLGVDELGAAWRGPSPLVVVPPNRLVDLPSRAAAG
jgi:hypothetical protein